MLLLVLLSCGVPRLKEQIDVANHSIQTPKARDAIRAFFVFEPPIAQLEEKGRRREL